MPLINAFRMDGLGNRFIIIDRREKSINIPKEKIIHLGNIKSFHRNIEFDQIIFIEKEINNTFPITIFNSDGGEVSACGNGSRCVAYLLGKDLNYKEIKLKTNKSIRLVKGSHIITKSLYSQKKAFTLQNEDNRIIFVIPYKDEYSLIGTTETEVVSPENPKIDESEIDYLLNSVNKYFIKQISRDDIVNSYSGIRPLIEDFKEASKVTRDYIFDLNEDGSQAPLLSIYGGKLTTYRKLAENVLLTLNKHIPINKKNSWTAEQKL